MKRLFAFTSLCLLIVMTCPAAWADTVACDQLGCLSEQQLLNNIVKLLNNNVVGYVVIVGGLPPVSGGVARTSTDLPKAAMSPDMPMNIQSVSKTLTAISILQWLPTVVLPGNTVPPSGPVVGASLDTPIWPYIYPDWKQNGQFGPNVDQITFRELLRHTSGFGQAAGCGDGQTYAGVKALVQAGVKSTDIGKQAYGNCNFALLRELLPALAGQQTILNDADGPTRAGASSKFYIDNMNTRVFAPLGIQTTNCTPVGAGGILSYPYPPDTTPGLDWKDWALMCGGGGWQMKASDLIKVINSLATGTVLLPFGEAAQMVANSSSGCLGWDCAVRSDCPNPYVCKNGGMQNGAISASTYAGIFKGTVPVVVYVNSIIPAPYHGFNSSGIPYTDECNASGIPNACCTGLGTGSCQVCNLPSGQLCGGDIIGLVASAYEESNYPNCSATYNCAQEFALTCTGANVQVTYNGNCQSTASSTCYQGCTGSPCTLTAGGNVNWSGPNTARACANNNTGGPAMLDACTTVTAAPVSCPAPPGGTAPRCSAPEVWCTFVTPNACTLPSACVKQSPKPPPGTPPG